MRVFGKMEEKFDVCRTRYGVVCSHLNFWVFLDSKFRKKNKVNLVWLKFSAETIFVSIYFDVQRRSAVVSSSTMTDKAHKDKEKVEKSFVQGHSSHSAFIFRETWLSRLEITLPRLVIIQKPF